MIEMYMNWNTLHKHQLNCCGTQEYKDWVNTTYSSGHIDMLIFFISLFCLQRLAWQCLIPLTFWSTTELGENVPDSCCLSTVIGCGLGVLSLSEEEVPFYCSCIFSHSLFLSTFFSSPSSFCLKAAMKIHTEGCLDIFSNQIRSNIGGVGGVGIGIGLIQVFSHWLGVL